MSAGAALEGGSGAQALGFLMRVQNAVNTFNDIQEFTFDILEAAEGDSDDLMMSLLQASAQALAGRLVGGGAKLGIAAGSAKKFEMHHIFPQRRDLKEQFERAGINIHKWKVRLERSVHKNIHRGARGGAWNDDWDKFLNSAPGGRMRTQSEMFDFAIEMMQRYGVNASQLY